MVFSKFIISDRFTTDRLLLDQFSHKYENKMRQRILMMELLTERNHHLRNHVRPSKATIGKQRLKKKRQLSRRTRRANKTWLGNTTDLHVFQNAEIDELKSKTSEKDDVELGIRQGRRSDADKHDKRMKMKYVLVSAKPFQNSKMLASRKPLKFNPIFEKI